jgi:hypothetical protein
MTKKINTYEDLLEEKERLQKLLQAQKDLVRADIAELKLKLKPAAEAAGFVSKFITRDNSNPIINLGISSAIDLLIKNVLLSKAGWLGRRIIPFLLKNFSSHVVDDNIEGIKHKVSSFLKKFSRNGKKVAE